MTEQTKTKQIMWRRDAFLIDSRSSQVLGIGDVIRNVLTERGVEIETDWDSRLPFRADVTRPDWEAICAAGREHQAAVEARMARHNSGRRCRVCGATETSGAKFTVDPRRAVCDDCF